MKPTLIAEEYSRPLSLAIANGETDDAKRMIETAAIDVNGFVDKQLWRPLVMEALISYSYKESEAHFEILQWLLEKGANANLCCKSGYNCLHLAAQQPKLIRILDLFLDYSPDVNVKDNNGANLLYWAIQAFPWRTEAPKRDEFLKILERILMLGADLDLPNRYGVTPRKWLEGKPEDVNILVARCETLGPARQAVTTDQPEFPSNLLYPEIADRIWKDLVPPQGYADTVQGELLRVIEKLRDESQRNGNVNFRKENKQMVVFLLDTLIKSTLFDRGTAAAIKEAVSKIRKTSRPYVDDDVYDFLTDQVCVFYSRNESLIPFKPPKK